MFNSKSRKRNTSEFRAIALGAIISILSFLALSFIASLILSALKNPLGFIGITAFAVIMLSGAVSGFLTSKIKENSPFLPTLISALLFTAIILCAGLIMSGGRISSLTAVNAAAYVIIAAAAALLGKRRHKRHRR